MNREKVKEIKKGLECCKQNEIEDTCKYCLDCPASDWDYEKECKIDLFQKTITLINELESENELLKVGNERFENNMRAVLEIEKKQAVKEFAEKLWNTIKDKGIDYKIGLRALGEEIDELLKEYENDTI